MIMLYIILEYRNFIVYSSFQYNINVILRENVQKEIFDLSSIMTVARESGYIKALSPVSPLDAQFRGFKTITTECSVFPIWKKLYDDYWINVEQYTRRLAEWVGVKSIICIVKIFKSDSTIT